MKLKRLLAATAVATIASSAVMAEGAYIGLEMIDSSIEGIDGVAQLGAEGITNTQSVYVGYESELTDSLTLDTRLNFIEYDKADIDGISYTIGLTQEIGNAEIYGAYAYSDGDLNISHKTTKVGVRYNF